MTQRQREGIAKYLYDLSKIWIGTVVVRNFVVLGEIDVLSLLVGLALAYGLGWWAYVLDGAEG